MQVRGDLVSCVLYTKAVARLPLRQLGFLVCFYVFHVLNSETAIVSKPTCNCLRVM